MRTKLIDLLKNTLPLCTVNLSSRQLMKGFVMQSLDDPRRAFERVRSWAEVTRLCLKRGLTLSGHLQRVRPLFRQSVGRISWQSLCLIAILSLLVGQDAAQDAKPRGVAFDLDRLSQPPTTYPAENIPADGVKAVFFEGLPYQGKPTKVLRRETKIPMLWVNGTNDFAYPMDSWLRSAELHHPSTLCLRIRMPHGHGPAGENPEEIHVFMNSILRGGKPFAKFVEGLGEGPHKMVRYKSDVRIVKAELCFTRDTGKWQDRKWESIPAGLSAETAHADLPRGATVWFFNLFDERDCVVTADVLIIRK